jgi:hypothetical protein
MATQHNPNFYIDGARKMAAEGTEVVSKIMAYMKRNQSHLQELTPTERKRAILDFEPSKMFNQVHPIVFQYLTTEGVFNANAFRRYVIAVYGKPKSEETQLKLRGDRRYVYHYKNEQFALYYKYLLLETNPSAKTSAIHSMYEDMVTELNKDTDRMLDMYEQAEKDSQIAEANYADEKKKDLLELLKKKIESDANSLI